jgi:hypothetical protein
MNPNRPVCMLLMLLLGNHCYQQPLTTIGSIGAEPEGVVRNGAAACEEEGLR